MNKAKLSILIGLIFMVFGLSLVIYIVRSQEIGSVGIINPPSYASDVNVVKTDEVIGSPDELIIPSLNINLQIVPGYYNKQLQTWTLTVNKVQYATITPEPNNVRGNTFLYGHARSAVFASLHNIQSNAQAIVKTTNNHTFYYILNGIKTTNPYNDSVFEYSGPPILTIQTCTGLFWQNRQFFTFNLEKAV